MKWVLEKFFWFQIKMISSRGSSSKKILSIPIPVLSVFVCVCVVCAWCEFLKLTKYGYNNLVYSRNFFLLHVEWILSDIEHFRRTLIPPLWEGTNLEE